jgi:hypothetical protein
MNEQIKLLAKQAGFNEYINENLWLEEQPEFNKLIEKFAELIVQECIDICQDVDGEDNIDARSGRQDCAVEIKEHFGVEV